MSILTVVQNALAELSQTVPSSVVGTSANVLASQMLKHAERTGKSLRDEYEWPQLVKEYTFTTSNGVAAYSLPADFERFVFMTAWDRANSWELIGPLSAEEWQFRKSGITSDPPRKRWRFKGMSTTQFYLDPTPASSDTLVFEYLSKNWIRPKTWVTSTAFGAASYCFYNGNYYFTSAGGTTGITPPTHTSSSASDGAVTWVYTLGPYEEATADTDVCHIDENIITLGAKYRWALAKGVAQTGVLKEEFEATCRRMFPNNVGASKISLNAQRLARTLYYPRTPESGFG